MRCRTNTAFGSGEENFQPGESDESKLETHGNEMRLVTEEKERRGGKHLRKGEEEKEKEEEA